MQKYVYLFELDSVRNTDCEIEIGQKAIYEEIAGNGNIVVLTYNQLIDSRGFFSLLSNDDYFDSFVKLFENGAIKISQFDDIRTVTQYIIRSFDFSKEFIFSGWPLKSSQKRLLALIKRSLIYSDLSEIEDYLSDRSKLTDLFVERIKSGRTDEDGNPVWEIQETKISQEDMEEILINIKAMIKLSLRLSPLTQIYIKPKAPHEYKNHQFYSILSHVLDFSCPGGNTLWNESVMIIRYLKAYADKCNSRSPYLTELLFSAQKDSSSNSTIKYQYAEAIIDQVYNYASEYSILNISKHYDDSSFEYDFFSRLEQDWGVGNPDKRFLLTESNKFDNYNSKKAIKNIQELVKLVEYNKKRADADMSDTKIYCYEHEFEKQKKKHRTHLLGIIGKECLVAVISILAVCSLEILLELGQNYLEDNQFIVLNKWVKIVVDTLVFLCIAECVSTFLSKIFGSYFMSLSEALGKFFSLIKMAFHVVGVKTSVYFNKRLIGKNSLSAEKQSGIIASAKTDALRNYLRLRNAGRDSIFTESNIYPIMDLDDDRSVEAIRRSEDLNGYQYGIVYQSKFNTLIVDPILKNGIIFPYERIVPTNGDGVVIVPIHNNNLILLEQYRHAIRKIQFSFPRGYGEKNKTPEENAIVELKQEIDAVIKGKPKFIGRVCSDSGLSSGTVYVYSIEVESYSLLQEYEGITNVHEIPFKEFEEMVLDNSHKKDCNPYDDGYTLSAYLLYKLNVANT